jgi:hypothetical protein
VNSDCLQVLSDGRLLNMTATRSSPAAQDADRVGLAAIGSNGGWCVSIDETTSGRWRCFLEIDGPAAYVRVPIESPEIVGKMLEYLTEPRHSDASARSGDFVIAGAKGDDFTLVRDDEFPDRCFLIVQTKSKTVVRITIGGDDWHAFIRAVRELQHECDA